MVASSGNPASVASERAARWLRQPVAMMPERRAERPSRAISSAVRRAPRAPRASALATMHDETRALEHRNGLDSYPRAAVDDGPKSARTCEVEHPGDSPLVDEIGVLGQRRRRQDPATAAMCQPGSELGRGGNGAAGDAQKGVRHRDVDACDLGGIAAREGQIEHERPLASRRECNRAGGGAHAAACAEQRDVALVV